jgi:hypothetical protein
VLSGTGLCDELITRPEESYRMCCVVVGDLETSRIGAPYNDIRSLRVNDLTLILLTWRKWWSNNASKYQIGFNSAFKGLNTTYDCNTFRRNQYCVHFLKPQSCGTNCHTYLTIFIVKILKIVHIYVFETGYRIGYVGKHKKSLCSNFLYYLTSLIEFNG